MDTRMFLNFILISLTSANVVKWLPNKSFSLAINFKDAKFPCPKQTVLFPENTLEAIQIDDKVDVAGLVLPKNGEILIDGELTLGGVGNDNCTEEGNVYYMPRSESSWNQADVWSSDKFNKATPDAERIPCFDDEVEFSPDAEFTVVLPNKKQFISSMKLGAKYDDFSFIMEDLNAHQQFVQNEFGSVGVVIKKEQCHARSGCVCQKNALKIDCSTKFCAKPKCVDPIKPIGHCCKICGGFMTLDIDETFNIMEFKDNVAKIVESYGGNSLDFHVGRIPGDKIQVVVVPKGEYTGTSAYVVQMIEYETGHFGVKSLASVSGSPLSKVGLGWKIFFSMFFAVALVMAAIYFYYYKLPKMPVRLPNLNRARRGIETQLARFNRRTDSVVSLTRRDSGATIIPGTPILGEETSFRNPMYDSRRGRVQLVEPVAEEDSDSLKEKVY